MPRHVLTLNDLGEEGSWLLVQQARGIPDAKSRTDFMTERTAVLLFAQDSFAERLCVSAAVRQMGGSLVFQGATGGWKSEVERYQRQMLAVIDYFVDCMYVYGIPGLATSVDRDLVQFPIINAGSPDAHPAHVLADVACMLRYTRDDLKKARVLLGTSPMQAIEVASDILASPASLLLLQSENRLRVHKRLLHWVFLENERVI